MLTNTGENYIRDGRAPLPEKKTTSIVMSANKGKDTGPELQLRKALYKKGLRGYRLHLKKLPGSPDIAFTKRKIVIFINGCFWHGCPYCRLGLPKSNEEFWGGKFKKNKERDKKKTTLLRQKGWKVIVVWECQIKKNLEKQIQRIKETLVD